MRAQTHARARVHSTCVRTRTVAWGKRKRKEGRPEGRAERLKPSSSLVWRSVWTSLEDQPKVVPVCFGPSPCKSLATYVGGYVVHIEYVTYTQLGENPNYWLVSCRYRGTGSASATCDPHRSLADIHLVSTVTGPTTCGREKTLDLVCFFVCGVVLAF